MMNQPRKASWLVRMSKGLASLCFLLVLTGLAIPSAFASAHAQNAATVSTNPGSPLRIKHAVELGTFDAGGITMINQQVGWTFTGRVQRTSDGGQTWQTVAQSNAQEYIGAVEVLDENITWYLTYDTQTYAPTALYGTGDGGQTWTRVPWVDPSQYMVGISMLDGHSAWVNTSDNNGASHLYLVDNSSQTWQAVTTPGPSNTFFISKEVGWSTVATPGNFNSALSLYETRDGGQTWTLQNLALPAGVPTSAIVTNIRLIGFGDLGFGAQLEGYLSVSLGDSASYNIYATQIYRTRDGGRSWQPYGNPEPSGPNDNVELITRIDQWHTPASWFIYARINGQVGLGALVAGKWTITYITLPANGYFLTVLTDREMFVSGPNADYTGQDLYKTQDGGATWQKITTVPN